MTRSRSHKEKPGNNYLVSQDDLLEGTSARTRPLSYDDIMLKRNNKGDAAKQVSTGSGVADVALGKDDIEKMSKFPEYRRQINENFEPMDVRHTSHDTQMVSSRRKGDSNAPKKNDKLVQVKDERSRDRDVKLKSIWEKTEGSKRVREGENGRRDHSFRKKDFLLGVDSYNGSNKRQVRDSYRKDKTSERGRGKSEIDRRQLLTDERHVHRKRKTERRMSSDFEKDYKRRNEREVMQTETNRGREKSEKENRHKRHNEEDKTESRSMDKKDDSERKGPERTRVSLDESRAKRRRSRSREREKDRVRRSHSHSPKAYKSTSKDKREHGELSSHFTKDRSEREHIDVDKKRISTNGSSGHNGRNTGTWSGLGGYSPRKRKTAAAAKTPSPTRRSPEKRTAGWDFQPVEKESIMASSVLPNLPPTPSQNLALKIKEFPSVIPATPTMMKPIVVSHQTISSQMHAIESVQLTQATRPMRRLYVENLPPSASEKDLIECINKSLLSYGVNYIQGTQPCISCMIHKEKSQALLEFLTPEDASSALALDGMSFSGSNLKLRRPKDFANITTGLFDKSVVAVDSISDIVEDSPHKIFIGGISKLMSSKMILEVARAFGHVKAFHFEFNADLNEPCAFLEYVDHSVTSKACAGLNGMKLGGRVVTAVFATPEAVLENVGKLPFYGIPEHAKPLLEYPTAVLKLKNVLDPEGFLTLSDSELEDILEDIKLECSRFGTVKSINVAKPTNSVAIMGSYEVKNTSPSTDAHDIELCNRSYSTEHLGESINPVGELDSSEPTETPNELENNGQTLEDNNGSDNTDEMIAGKLMKDQIYKPPSNDENVSVKESENPGGFAEEPANEQNASVIELEGNDNIAGSISETKTEMENKPFIEGDLQPGEEMKLEENNAPEVSYKKDIAINLENADMENKLLVEGNSRGKLEIEENNASEEGNKKNITISVDLENVFEPASVCVEYRRSEAACMAAHCLHGRVFDGRVVTVGYVGQDLYQMWFHK